MWPDRRIIDLFGIEHPIILAPMAGPSTAELAIAVAEAGGLGSLACATSSPEQIRKDLGIIRQRTARPLNLNFFTHKPPEPDAARDAKWKARLAAYYKEFAIDPAKPVPSVNREPFNDINCEIVEEFKPEIVSFHFGLPERRLLARVKATGAKVMASATTAREAQWLADHGCDAIIAQGNEAGGHRGMFLTDNIASQAGTFALLPQVVDAVKLPVIAAGGSHRRARHRRRLRPRRRGGTGGHRLSLLSGGQCGTAPPDRIEIGPRQLHRADQPLHRPAGARHHQPRDARSGADLGRCASLSHRRRRAGAAKGCRRGQGLRRFRFALVRSGRIPRPRDAGGGSHPASRPRGFGAPQVAEWLRTALSSPARTPRAGSAPRPTRRCRQPLAAPCHS